MDSGLNIYQHTPVYLHMHLSETKTKDLHQILKGRGNQLRTSSKELKCHLPTKKIGKQSFVYYKKENTKKRTILSNSSN